MAPLRPVLRRILADVQERLTFRAQAFIKVCKVSVWRSCMLWWLQITVRGNARGKLLDGRNAWEPAGRDQMCTSLQSGCLAAWVSQVMACSDTVAKF